MSSPRIEAAIQHQRAGQFAQARALYEGVLRDEPRNVAALNLLGVVLQRQNETEAALAPLREALRLKPDFAEAALNLGIALQTLGRYEDAVEVFRVAAVLHPDDVPALGRLGTCLQLAGDIEGAIACQKRVRASDPHAADSHFNLAAALHTNGELEDAVVAYARGLATVPANANALGLMGGALLGLGRMGEAEAAFDAALAHAPSDTQALRGRGRCALYRGVVAASGRSDLPDGLLVRGLLSGPSGYAHMARHFIQHLRDQDVRLEAMGLFAREPWQPPNAAEAPEAMVPLEGPVRAGTVLNFLIPAAVEPVPGLRTVNFSMFEGTRIPDYWVRFNRRHDLVIVPTQSSRVAWVESGFPEERLRVCPLGVDTAIDRAAIPPLAALTPGGRPVSSYRTRILNVSDFVPRKNIDGLLRVWLRTTTPDDDAVLIVKVGKGNAAQMNEIRDIVLKSQAAVGKTLAQAAPVVVVNVKLSDMEMLSLFAMATHYWSMSHGEGWDLPMTQAGALDLQLIAPDHSAYQDYLDDRIAWLIPAHTEPARRPYSRTPWSPFFGLDWWQPDEDHAVALIGRIVRGQETPRTGARDWLRTCFSWRQATERLVGLLRDDGLLP